MRWIGGLLGGLWRFSRRSWISVDEDLRPRSPASGLYLFLFLLLFVVGLVLVLLGVDLASVDRWLDSHADLLDAIGSRLFNVLCGAILAICALIVGAGLWQRFVAPTREVADADRLGFGAMIGAVLVGYFAWFGMTG